MVNDKDLNPIWL